MLNISDKYLSAVIKGFFAGLFIGIGGFVFLSSPSKIIGAVLFSVGLFTILNFKLNLFTGKICYLIEKKNHIEVLLTLVGNFLGTLAIAGLLSLASPENIKEAAIILCEKKLEMNWWNPIILGFFCNVLIYLAVHGFNKFESPINKFFAVIFGVVVFIICGFEHSIADMFYFFFAHEFSIYSFIFIALVLLGNSLGGIVSHLFLGGESL